MLESVVKNREFIGRFPSHLRQFDKMLSDRGLENYCELSGVLEDFQVSHGSAQRGNLSDHKSDFTLQSRDSCRAYRVSK